MRNAQQQGFALLDTIVALAIVGVVFAFFAQVVQSSLLARHQAGQRRLAVMVAQSQLAQVVEGAVEPRTGRYGDLVWRSEVSSYPGLANAPELQRLVVTVSDPVGGHVLLRLETLRLAR